MRMGSELLIFSQNALAHNGVPLARCSMTLESALRLSMKLMQSADFSKWWVCHVPCHSFLAYYTLMRVK